MKEVPALELADVVLPRIEAGVGHARSRIERLREERDTAAREVLLAEAAAIRSELDRLQAVAALAMVLEDG